MKLLTGMLKIVSGKSLAICLFFCLGFLQCLPLHAAGDSLHYSQRYSFSPYPDSRSSIVNHFLLKIAEGNGKLRAYTSYTIEGVLGFEPMYDDEAGCTVKLQVTPRAFLGDVTYMDFGLEALLTPDLLSFELTILTSDGSVLHHELFEDIEISENGIAFVSTKGEWCFGDVYKAEPGKLNFYYSDGLFERFDSWLDALESYYNAGEKLVHIEPILLGLGYNDPERLIMDEFHLCEAEQMLADIRYASFHRWIDLSRGDPEQLLGEYERLAVLADSLRRGFNRSISCIDTLFYEKALMYQQEGDTLKARQLFEQALVYNPFHIPSNLSLVSYDLELGEIKKALHRLEEVVAVMHPFDYWWQQTIIISDSVLHEYFMEASELIEDGRFLDALVLLGDVERFCVRTDGRFDCPPLLFYHLSLSHQGMFRSFMVVSERAYRNGNLSFCVEYLRNAIQYQEENSAYVSDASQAIALMQKVYAQYRQQGEHLYANGNRHGASEYFMNAKELCEEFPFLTCP